MRKTNLFLLSLLLVGNSAYALTVNETVAVDSASSIVVDVDGDSLPDLQSVGGREELQKFNAGAGQEVKDVSRQTPKRDFGDRVVVRGWDAEKKEAVDNLKNNAKAIIEADENIASAEISPEKVKVSYKQSAKLFGFIPVAYYHAFTVDGKGNISHGTPWWLALATSDAKTFGPDVAEVFQHNQSDLRFIKAPTQLEWQMQRFSMLSNVMKARHEAAMNSIRNMK